MNHNPCWKCKRREVGCHGKCQDYAVYKRQRERQRFAVHKQETADRYEDENAYYRADGRERKGI